MTTSFQSFKFIELYSVIQTFSVIMLYTVGSSLMDFQFLYIDLVALIPLSIVQAWTGSYEKLTKDRPPSSLFYFPVFFSVLVSALIQIGFQLFFFFNVKEQPFYQVIPPDPEEFSTAVYENSVLFMATNFQYLITCVSFSVAYPFRKPIWTNCWYSFFIVFIFVLNCVILLSDTDSEMSVFFEILPFQDPAGNWYKIYQLWMGYVLLLNCVVTYVAEKLIVHWITPRWDLRTTRAKQVTLDVQMEAYRAKAAFLDDSQAPLGSVTMENTVRGPPGAILQAKDQFE